MSTRRTVSILAITLLAGCSEKSEEPRATPVDSSVSDVSVRDSATDNPDAGDDGSLEAATDATDAADAADATDDGLAEDADVASDSDAAACAPALTTTKTTGTCEATVRSWVDEGHLHVDPGAAVSYCTTPPSSGTHYSVWAAYRTYDKPVPYGYLVHDQEHGAVVILYRCSTASLPCAEKQAALEAIAAGAVPTDSLCTAPVSRRIIIAPDPTLPVEVGAAAWTWTYNANCIDATTLGPFITAHYAKATEDLCADGVVPP